MAIYKKALKSVFAKLLLHSVNLYHYFSNTGFMSVTKTTEVL
jgi:hypothetical protein